ncbi:TPA: helix-turn-helix domain-containing protein [Enterobacter hormaechei subsp. steigerwaltii]|nr:helix-turn-helix domain-containing protein [Enterobacter hormaechei subsp. steigerwaltii]
MLYKLPDSYVSELSQGAPIRALDAKHGIDKNASLLLRRMAGLRVVESIPSQDRWQAIRPLLERGLSQRAIAAELNYSLSTVHRTIKAHQ